MGDTSIEWTDKTWNPVRGCSRVSPGCVNCYAERQALRFAWPYEEGGTQGPFHGFVTQVNGHPAWTGKVEVVQEHLEDPLRWWKPRRIFVNSMSDLFHEVLPDEAIDRVFAVMALAQVRGHVFQVLTKRADRMLNYISHAMSRVAKLTEPALGPLPDGMIWPIHAVWLGVSVEDQQRAEERISLLLQTPAAIRFVSYEPALGPVDFGPWLDGHEEHGIDLSRETGAMVGCCVGYTPPLDWVIVGGESGPGARAFSIEWMRATVRDCRRAGVPVFCKQIGSNPHWGGYPMGRAAVGDRKGGEMEEWPEDLRIRQFPGTAHVNPHEATTHAGGE